MYLGHRYLSGIFSLHYPSQYSHRATVSVWPTLASHSIWTTASCLAIFNSFSFWVQVFRRFSSWITMSSSVTDQAQSAGTRRGFPQGNTSTQNTCIYWTYSYGHTPIDVETTLKSLQIVLQTMEGQRNRSVTIPIRLTQNLKVFLYWQ